MIFSAFLLQPMWDVLKIFEISFRNLFRRVRNARSNLISRSTSQTSASAASFESEIRGEIERTTQNCNAYRAHARAHSRWLKSSIERSSAGILFDVIIVEAYIYFDIWAIFDRINRYANYKAYLLNIQILIVEFSNNIVILYLIPAAHDLLYFIKM